jgi:hypothetical protein
MKRASPTPCYSSTAGSSRALSVLHPTSGSPLLGRRRQSAREANPAPSRGAIPILFFPLPFSFFSCQLWRKESLLPHYVVMEGFVEEVSPAWASVLCAGERQGPGVINRPGSVGPGDECDTDTQHHGWGLPDTGRGGGRGLGGTPPPKIARAQDYLSGYPTTRLTSPQDSHQPSFSIDSSPLPRPR